MPPVILAVEVHQVDAKHLPVVVADQGVTVNHAVDEDPAFQRHFTRSRHFVPGCNRILQPNDPPRHTAHRVAGDVVQARFRTGVRVRVHDSDNVSLVLRSGVVFRVQDEVVRFFRLIAARLISWLAAHADDQADRLAWVLRTRVRLGISPALVEKFAHDQSLGTRDIPGKPPNGNSSLAPNRSLQPATVRLHWSLERSLVGRLA
ncbi:hypothetical protein D3C87_1573520 [compost metagenome]